MDYKIRSLKTRDLFRVSGLLKKAIEKGAKGLDTAMVLSDDSTPSKDVSPEERGKEIILSVIVPIYDYVEDELIEWTADLCQISREEFLDAPSTLIFDVIDALSESEESKDFFNRALRLSKNLNGFARRLKDVLGLSSLFSNLENANLKTSTTTTSWTGPERQAGREKKKSG